MKHLRIPVRGLNPPWLAALTLALALFAGAPLFADLVRDADSTPAPDARAAFELIKRAFEESDQQVLADLVNADGLLIRSGGTGGRDTDYSPSQAFYYFKNLFQSQQTVTFTYLRMEETTVGERIHALAQWTRRAPHGDGEQDVRLVFVLIRQDQQWRLAEITTIG